MAPHPAPRTPRTAPAGGWSLIDALVALAVLSLALLGALHWHAAARSEASLAAERTEALQLAQADLERVRTRLGLEPGAAAVDDVDGLGDAVDATTPVDDPRTAYTLHRQVLADATAQLTAVVVRVAWSDRSGAPQQVRVQAALDGLLPVHSAVLSLPSPPAAAAGVAGRHATVPRNARNLGDGRSAWTPRSTGAVGGLGGATVLIDNLTGQATGLCDAVPAASTTPADCRAVQGTWLAGHVRASLSAPPDAARANETPPAFSLRLADAGQPLPLLCETGATAAPDGERFASFTCLVPLPNGSVTWSGRLDLQPDGWTLGTRQAAHRRVCRYSADLDGSGAIDRNEEHPGRYTDVAGPLLQQNFLLVRGDQACPRGAAGLHNGGSPSTDTVLHQP